MSRKKTGGIPNTQHNRIAGENNDIDSPFVNLDNPDDRITEQNGDATTLVKNDNPDDIEAKPFPK